MNRERLIEVSGLSFLYEQAPKNGRKKALDNISLNIEKGDFVVITGTSGCGKSTLCKCLNGLIPQASKGIFEGTVNVCGMDTVEHPVYEFAPYVCMVFQNPDNQLFSNNVESELAFGPENLGLDRDEIERRVRSALSAVSIEHLRDRPVDDLSGGEKQRVAIASAMAMRPQILVMDEPTSEIDPAGAFSLIKTLKDLNEIHGITVILVEHRIERLLDVMKRLIVMNEGRIIFDGHPKDVFTNDLLSMGIGEPPLVRFSKRFGLSLDTSVSGINLNGISGSYTQDREINRPLPVVSVKDLYFKYHGRKHNAINGVSLDFYPGEIAMIMGGNGSGKTTLVKHMNGLLRPDSGEVTVKGDNIKNKTIAEISKKIGLVFQNASYQIFEETIYGELAFAPKNVGLPEIDINRRVNDVAGALGLDMLGMSSSPHLLSGGEKQRVTIGSILTLEPDIIVMDEPTLGLDKGHKDDLAAMVRALKGKGKSIIVITHDVEFAAANAERVILMSGGYVIADGHTRDILTSRELISKASLHLPQATEIGIRMGMERILNVEEFTRAL
ncbi:hypothetical protein CUJ83_00360 [Methanocella sp. CWC-04]|uniref:ABC transporter domain-containing protein n=1 Tax=Methanooceanicella nereidis TaxID=2052831 RepID=A0AAP2RB86_9EURY|nr:ABC transporter ATP-binding protein [Methanocella sp. CWC-04]MCD1293450.1 hypothetical protein [Methanocella sp. CWC-04]